MGHVIDPRTGWPSGDALAITLVCQSAAMSDALATAMFVQGQAAATQFMTANPQLGMVYVMPTSRANEVEAVACGLREGCWEPFG